VVSATSKKEINLLAVSEKKTVLSNEIIQVYVFVTDSCSQHLQSTGSVWEICDKFATLPHGQFSVMSDSSNILSLSQIHFSSVTSQAVIYRYIGCLWSCI